MQNMLPPEPDAGIASSAGRHVVIVAESESLRELLGTVLEDAGYRVAQAADDEAAWTHLQLAQPWAGAILDLDLPGQSSWELLATLRRDPLWADLPVVTLGESEANDPRLEKLRGNAYLGKPFSLAQLRASVRRTMLAP